MIRIYAWADIPDFIHNGVKKFLLEIWLRNSKHFWKYKLHVHEVKCTYTLTIPNWAFTCCANRSTVSTKHGMKSNTSMYVTDSNVTLGMLFVSQQATSLFLSALFDSGQYRSFQNPSLRVLDQSNWAISILIVIQSIN